MLLVNYKVVLYVSMKENSRNKFREGIKKLKFKNVIEKGEDS